MPDLRKWFRKNVAHVRADANKASNELMGRLKRMMPAEFLRLPPKTFESLTAAQYKEVVATIAPDTILPAPQTAEEFPIETRSWRDWWRERSTLTKVTAITVATTLTINMAAILSPLAWKWLWSRMEIVRPTSSTTWPTCVRLSHYTDGCVYHPVQDLNWAWVAQQLDIPVDELYAANRHLSPHYIPAQSALVIWRHRGRLEP